ncbi:hypothetical protein [Curtobacterium sp. MCBD17_003]|uniref:hypothetical protein n=1 Tax=Curtobacterium sp. MCBD17_003 TaxID=2175667 RepID=UPI000DA9CA81|nr:hypothetical protein [Curtobacterium sp. MCBD17_003]WIE54233.1 hypothetical protein DEI88_014080 [Curtobacterium sp. MCBD17_003]
MVWDNTPWAIGGGAQVPVEVGRVLAFAGTGGAEGVVVPGDLKVVPLAVPGTSVRVSAGAALVINRATGSPSQTYVIRNPTEDVVPIAATTSAGGRSDLLVAEVQDPFVQGTGFNEPADPTTAAYVKTVVVPNVPAGTKRLQDLAGHQNDSAVTLARIDLPASTGTITAAMITDLRNVARPRQQSDSYYNLGTITSELTSTAYVLWPGFAPVVTIPSWATYVQVEAFIASLTTAKDSHGSWRFDIETSTGGTKILTGDEVGYDFDTDDGLAKFTQLVAAQGSVQAFQGQAAKLALYAKRAPDKGTIKVDSNAQVVLRVTFSERTV